MSFKKALAWSIFWIGLSMLVAVGVAVEYGTTAANLFLTGYVLEKALSVDNLFVFLMLFTYFKIDATAQRRVLNYGIGGVLLLRGILIFAGIALVQTFGWIMYLFGVIVIYTGFIMAFGGDDEFDAEQNKTIRFVSKYLKVSNEASGDKFFVRKNGRLFASPLFVVLVVVELTDVFFAVDSIPAVLSVTRDPFIVYGSNILAVLGLRSLYFLLERMQTAFRFVKQGVGVILWFVGVKMLLPLFNSSWEIDNTISLSVILGILLISIVASVSIKAGSGGTPK